MEVRVGIADLAVCVSPARLVTVGLGSCVGIALYAPRERIGALAHVLLPQVLRADAPPGKVPATAVPAMVRRMRELGATDPIEARLVGGASLFPGMLAADAVGLGQRNLVASREALAAADIAIVGEVTGGACGRSVVFDVASGSIDVRTVGVSDVRI